MTLAPLIAASPTIQIHTAAALLSAALAALLLLRRKGDGAHRLAGRVWVAAMALAALSSFGIAEIRDGRFSPIHILSLVTLVSLIVAVRAARRGDVRRHRLVMLWLTFGALLVAGGFTLLPGRIMHAVLTGG